MPGRGSCLCGDIRYAVSGTLREIVVCHCGQCRKQMGMMMATDAKRSEIVIANEDKLVWYRASDFAARGSCPRCGTTLFWLRDGAETISIAAGTLDEDGGVKVERHIFVADKGDRYEIGDGLPQYDYDDSDGPPRPRR